MGIKWSEHLEQAGFKKAPSTIIGLLFAWVLLLTCQIYELKRADRRILTLTTDAVDRLDDKFSPPRGPDSHDQRDEELRKLRELRDEYSKNEVQRRPLSEDDLNHLPREPASTHGQPQKADLKPDIHN